MAINLDLTKFEGVGSNIPSNDNTTGKEIENLAKGYAQQFVQGAAWGQAPHLAGVNNELANLPKKVYSIKNWRDAGRLYQDLGKDYVKSREQFKKESKEFEEENPYTSLGANIIGGALTGGALSSGLKSVVRAAIPRAMAEGGIYGLSFGASNTEGKAFDPVGSAVGATAGAVGGAALGGLGKVAKKLFLSKNTGKIGEMITPAGIHEDTMNNIVTDSKVAEAVANGNIGKKVGTYTTDVQNSLTNLKNTISNLEKQAYEGIEDKTNIGVNKKDLESLVKQVEKNVGSDKESQKILKEAKLILQDIKGSKNGLTLAQRKKLDNELGKNLYFVNKEAKKIRDIKQNINDNLWDGTELEDDAIDFLNKKGINADNEGIYVEDEYGNIYRKTDDIREKMTESEYEIESLKNAKERGDYESIDELIDDLDFEEKNYKNLEKIYYDLENAEKYLKDSKSKYGTLAEDIDKLYKIKQDAIKELNPKIVAYHQFDDGNVRPMYKIGEFEFHGEPTSDIKEGIPFGQIEDRISSENKFVNDIKDTKEAISNIAKLLKTIKANKNSFDSKIQLDKLKNLKDRVYRLKNSAYKTEPTGDTKRLVSQDIVDMLDNMYNSLSNAEKSHSPQLKFANEFYSDMKSVGKELADLKLYDEDTAAKSATRLGRDLSGNTFKLAEERVKKLLGKYESTKGLGDELFTNMKKLQVAQNIKPDSNYGVLQTPLKIAKNILTGGNREQKMQTFAQAVKDGKITKNMLDQEINKGRIAVAPVIDYYLALSKVPQANLGSALVNKVLPKNTNQILERYVLPRITIKEILDRYYNKEQ